MLRWNMGDSVWWLLGWKGCCSCMQTVGIWWQRYTQAINNWTLNGCINLYKTVGHDAHWYFQVQLQFIQPNLVLVLESFIWIMSSVMVLSQNLLTAPIWEWEFTTVSLQKMQESYVAQVIVLHSDLEWWMPNRNLPASGLWFLQAYCLSLWLLFLFLPIANYDDLILYWMLLYSWCSD